MDRVRNQVVGPERCYVCETIPVMKHAALLYPFFSLLSWRVLLSFKY